MKLQEIVEHSTDARISDFLDRWYSEHEGIKQSEIEELLKDFPQFRIDGYVERAVGIPTDTMEKHGLIAENPDEEIDTEKTEAFIAAHEPKRYVSGSASNSGMDVFLVKSGLDSNDYTIVVGYDVKKGLYLKKMVQSLAKPNSKQLGIAEVDEVLFRPSNGEISTWHLPEK